jgi:hypothetical protein
MGKRFAAHAFTIWLARRSDAVPFEIDSA